jgi:lambda repressor-like predicted transcriptional regulator
MDLCTKLPATPLRQVIVRKKRVLDLTWEELACRLGVSDRTLWRVMTDPWIGICAADHMALRLGLHPSNLWPKEWGACERRAASPTRKG